MMGFLFPKVFSILVIFIALSEQTCQDSNGKVRMEGETYNDYQFFKYQCTNGQPMALGCQMRNQYLALGTSWNEPTTHVQKNCEMVGDRPHLEMYTCDPSVEDCLALSKIRNNSTV